jgi:hypothetical protein
MNVCLFASAIIVFRYTQEMSISASHAALLIIGTLPSGTSDVDFTLLQREII